MSQASVVAEAATIDWNVVAAAVAVFIATLVTTIGGWLSGRKKVDAHLKGDKTAEVQIAGVTVQDNQTLREATLVSREVRDQLLIHGHSLAASCKATEDNTRAMDDILEELKRLRHHLESRG